jgi:hypothetical protein
MFVLAELVSVGYGQGPKAENTPFTLTWSEGKCLGCKIAARLGEIQFVSRSEVWAVGSEDHLGGVNVVVVHSTDAGRTWREVLGFAFRTLLSPHFVLSHENHDTCGAQCGPR